MSGIWSILKKLQTDYIKIIGLLSIALCTGLLYDGLTLFHLNDTNPVLGFLSCCIFAGADAISRPFILLTLIVYIPIMLYYLYSTEKASKLLFWSIVAIHLSILVAFSTRNLFLFYVGFESLLFPTFIVIIQWGSRGRKIHAALSFFFYTFFSSVFLLVGLMYIYWHTHTFNLDKIVHFPFSGEKGCIILTLFFLGFLSKIPAFPVHIWLPEAHVEAPTIGSVILASLILKLSFYGLVRIVSICSLESVLEMQPYFVTILLISMIFAAIVATRQIDIKKIIAYSSIVHMNLGTIALFMESSEGWKYGLFSMFSHGLVSAGLFFGVGMIYQRTGTRDIMLVGGLAQLMPVFSILYGIIILANMGMPFTCGFISEWLVYLVFNGKLTLLLLVASVSFPSCIFCLRLLVGILFTQVKVFHKPFADLSYPETVVLFYLVLFIILFGILPDAFFTVIMGLV